MPGEMSPLRLREEPVSVKVGRLTLEPEFLTAMAPVGQRASVVGVAFLLVLAARPLPSLSIDTEAERMILEPPPCPGPGAWMP